MKAVTMSLAAMIDHSAVAAVISNPRLPDNPIVECNAAFEQLTGYSRDEIIGRNCRFLAGPKTEPALTAEIVKAVTAKRPVLVEILNYKKDGTPFRNAVLVAPIFDAEGELEYFLGSQMEVGGVDKPTEQDRQGQSRAKVEQLSLRQREVLVQMAAGKLNKQIAYTLGITERTVKMHRAAVLKALEVNSSADAIRIAVEAGY
jgi:PAS domain S-box-containing protein